MIKGIRKDMKTKSVIINADDFGLSEEINKGIVQSFKKGIVTSTSLLVNREGFEDAVIKIKQNPKLDIGIHLNIFRGKPLTKLSYIVNKKGRFLENQILFFLKYSINKKLFAKEASQEFEAQIKKAKMHKIKISHIDTEKHIHIFPEVMKAVIHIAKKYKINAIRFPFESYELPIKSDNSQNLKNKISRIFYNKNIRILKANNIKVTKFYGISLSKNYSLKNLTIFLNCLKQGVTELSCHPGMNSKKSSYIDSYREQELKVLTSSKIKEEINKNKIELTNFTRL